MVCSWQVDVPYTEEGKRKCNKSNSRSAREKLGGGRGLKPDCFFCKLKTFTIFIKIAGESKVIVKRAILGPTLPVI